MPLTDQQLRQELLGYGENVPPITQRNREQLRARLEVLRGQARPKSTTASPTRSRAGVAASSPSKARASTLGNASPSRTRSGVTPTSSTSRPSTRSRATNNLIELSDSEVDASATTIETLATRSAGPTTRTRSTTSRRQLDALNASIQPGPTIVMSNDVEQSIARHRREIKQLLDSARDRSRATSSALSNVSQAGQNSTTPPETSPTIDEIQKTPETTSQPTKPTTGKHCFNNLQCLLKIFLITSFLVAGSTLFVQNFDRLFPAQKEIECSLNNIVSCVEMKPVIDAVRKQLRIRKGEAECGFRTQEDVLISRNEIEKYLDDKHLVFKQGKDFRWDCVINYIINKPVSDILLWNNENQQTQTASQADKLSSETAIRSLTCEARQNIDATARNLALGLIGSLTLLTSVWFLYRRPKFVDTNEETFRNVLKKTIDLLEEQYEKHTKDPQTEPWLIISQIRDKLIPDHDQQRLTEIWERVQKYINEQESRVCSASQLISGEQLNVWQWIKSNSSSAIKTSSISPKKTNDETFSYSANDVGLTECLKLRNFFGSETDPDDKTIDQVVDDVQKRCSSVKRIEHIGIHSVFVYLKFSSKEAAAHGYHLLNNWKYNGEEINAKYVRLIRYYDHFPEAQESN